MRLAPLTDPTGERHVGSAELASTPPIQERGSVTCLPSPHRHLSRLLPSLHVLTLLAGSPSLQLRSVRDDVLFGREFQSCSQAPSLFNGYPRSIARQARRGKHFREAIICVGFVAFTHGPLCGKKPSGGLAGYARGYARQVYSRASRYFASGLSFSSSYSRLSIGTPRYCATLKRVALLGM